MRTLNRVGGWCGDTAKAVIEVTQKLCARRLGTVTYMWGCEIRDGGRGRLKLSRFVLD